MTAGPTPYIRVRLGSRGVTALLAHPPGSLRRGATGLIISHSSTVTAASAARPAAAGTATMVTTKRVSGSSM